MNMINEISVLEDELLKSVTSIRKNNSRLSCQIKLLPGVDELTVFVPDSQN
jgi:ferredoxin